MAIPSANNEATQQEFLYIAVGNAKWHTEMGKTA